VLIKLGLAASAAPVGAGNAVAGGVARQVAQSRGPRRKLEVSRDAEGRREGGGGGVHSERAGERGERLRADATLEGVQLGFPGVIRVMGGRGGGDGKGNNSTRAGKQVGDVVAGSWRVPGDAPGDSGIGGGERERERARMREREKKRMLEDLARIKVEGAVVGAELEARKQEWIKVEVAGVGAEVEARKRELARQAHAGRQRESESKTNMARHSHREAGPEMIMDSTLGATLVTTPVTTTPETTPSAIPIPPETLRAGAMLGEGEGAAGGGGGGGAMLVPLGRKNHLEGSYFGNGLGDVCLSDLEAVLLFCPPPPPPLVYTLLSLNIVPTLFY
jgi:hypothetical protein